MENTTIILRVPTELKRDLEMQAQKNVRSMNGECQVLLREGLVREKKK